MDIAILLLHAVASEWESSREMRLRVSQTSLPELTSVYSRNVIQTLGLRSSVTLSDQIFNALVEEIISGAIEPGFRLDEPSICRKFNVSRTPIREALRRLNGAGLVEITPRRGVTVARINILELNEMFEALAEFEGLCAGLSAVRMTSLEKKRLEMLNKSAQSRIAKGQGDLVRLNNEFHEFDLSWRAQCKHRVDDKRLSATFGALSFTPICARTDGIFIS